MGDISPWDFPLSAKYNTNPETNKAIQCTPPKPTYKEINANKLQGWRLQKPYLYSPNRFFQIKQVQCKWKPDLKHFKCQR